MTFARPKALDQALELLAQESWTILAGGTDFYPSLRGQSPTGPVLDITAIEDLSGISVTEQGYRIGAMASWTDLVNADLPAAFNALQQSALAVGSVQIQNRATVVGNLCNASPAADGVPPLLCLDAVVELSSRTGVRRLRLEEFIHGNRRTGCQSDELVTAIVVPHESAHGHSEFLKLGTRCYLVISIAMVAVRVKVTNDKIDQIAIAVGSCSEVAKRLHGLEAVLQGMAADCNLRECVQPEHLAGLKPITDIRSTADYRQVAALELVIRSIAGAVACDRAAGGGVSS